MSNYGLSRCNYYTAHTTEDLQFKISTHINQIVLTPFLTNTTKTNCIVEILQKNTTCVLRVTPKTFFDSLCKVACEEKHIIVEDIELLKGFGYEKSMKQIIGLKRFYFIFPCTGKSLLDEYDIYCMYLNLNKFCMNYSKEYAYLALFILCKSNTYPVVICKNIKKVLLFCEIANLKCEVVDKFVDKFCTRTCFVLDEYVDVNAYKVVYIGFDLDCQKIELNLQKTQKLLYRIKDVMNSLTKSVVCGRKKLNTTRLKNALSLDRKQNPQ